MTPATLRLRQDSVEWRLVDDEIVALTVREDRYLGANKTGALLWQKLAEGTDTASLLALLQDQGATPEQAGTDLSTFLDALRERGLLED